MKPRTQAVIATPDRVPDMVLPSERLPGSAVQLSGHGVEVALRNRPESTGLKGKRAGNRDRRSDNGNSAGPRKSHSKSQRRPVSGDTQLRQATVEAGHVPTERYRATPCDAREVTGGQGVADSNPAVPTGS